MSDTSQPRRRGRYTKSQLLTVAMWLASFSAIAVLSLIRGDSYAMKVLDGLVLSGTLRHLLGYSVIAFWPANRESREIALKCGLAALLLGILIEVIQGFVGRDFEVRDMFTNGCGIALGMSSGMLSKRIFRNRVLTAETE